MNPPFQIPGVRYVNPYPNTPENLYSSVPSFGSHYEEVEERLQPSLDFMNQLFPNGPEDMGSELSLYQQSGRREFSRLEGSPSYIQGLKETQEALNEVFKGKAKEIELWDTETLGNAAATTYSASQKTNFFDITQISLHPHLYENGKLTSAVKDPTVLAVQISDSTYKELNNMLNLLENDPSSLFQFNDREKGSLADLVLFENKNHFQERDFAGRKVKVMTGQAENKVSYKGTALSEMDNIQRMRQGLENIYNKDLTNSQEETANILSQHLSTGKVMAGHNVQNFDKPVLKEWAQRLGGKNAQQLETVLNNPQIDTYRLAQPLLGKELTPNSKNFQLGNLYQQLYPEGDLLQAHFAGADTEMNGMVLDRMFAKINKGEWDTGKGLSAHSGDVFFAKEGTQSYFESSFNRNRGQHDAVMRYDQGKGEWVRNYKFGQSPISSGHNYQILGHKEKVSIGGKEQNVLLMQDLDNQTVQAIFRSNDTEINDLFQNTLVKVTKENAKEIASEKAYIKNDQARRFVDDTFSPRMRNQKDTIENRLRKIEEVYSAYDKEVSLLEKSGLVKESIHGQALQNTFHSLNAGQKDSQYWRSMEKMEHSLTARSLLETELPFWNQVVEDSIQFAGGDTSAAGHLKQNIYVHNMWEAVGDLAPREQRNIGHAGMEVIPLSLNGDMTYFNLNSREKFGNRIRQTLKSSNKNSSMVERDFLDLIANDSLEVSDRVKRELSDRVRKELRTDGQVSEATIQSATQQLYLHAKGSSQKQSFLPGEYFQSAVSDGTSGRSQFVSNLHSKESAFYKALTEDVTATSRKQFHSGDARTNFGRFDLDNLSDPAKQRIKKAEQISMEFDSKLTQTMNLYKFDNQQMWKKKKGTDYQSSIQEVLDSFSGSFDTRLDYNGSTDQLSLFFTEKGNHLQLPSLSSRQLAENKQVHKVSLPLFTEEYGISFGGTTLMNEYRYNRKSVLPDGIAMENTADRAFSTIKNIPRQIEREKEKLQRQGKSYRSNEVVEKTIGRANFSIRNGSVAAAYAGDTSPYRPYTTSSPTKNFAQGLAIDISSHGDDVLRQEFPDVYKDFLNWKEETGSHENFLKSSFYTPRDLHVREKVQSKLVFDFNEKVGSKHGLRVTRQGGNAKQAMAGKAFIQDPRSFTPLGIFNPSPREQILKTQNYHGLEQADLERYLDGRTDLTDAQKKRRLQTSLSESEALMNPSSKGQVSTIGTRIQFTDDASIAKRSRVVGKEIEQQISELTSEMNVATGSAKKNLESRINHLREQKQFLDSGVLSVYDGQMLIRESLAESMVVRDTMNVRLKTGYQLPKGIEDVAKGLEHGEVRFDKPISYGEMKKMDLLTKDGLLTVGNIVEESAKLDGEDSAARIARSQPYRIYENSQIVGIRRDEKGEHLLLEQIQKGKDGFKIIDGNTGERTTAIGVRDDILDRLYPGRNGKKIDVIREQINIGRNPYGGVLATVLDTNYENMVEELEKMAAGEKSSLKGLSSIQEKLDKGILTTGDLSKVDVREKIFHEAFEPILKPLGMENTLYVDPQTGRLVYKNIENTNKMVGAAGKDNFKEVLNRSRELFDFSEDYAYGKSRWHDTPHYQGASVRPKYSQREWDILNLSLNKGEQIASGEYSPLLSHLQSLADSERVTLENREYAKRMGRSSHYLRKNPEEVTGVNNVILDMTGKIGLTKDQNIVKVGDNYHFDATLLGALPDTKDASKLDLVNTMADPDSILLNNPELGIHNQTLGSFVKEHDSNALLKIRSQRDGNIQQNYVPVLGQISQGMEQEAIMGNEVQKNLERVYRETYDYNSQLYSTQDFSHDLIRQQGERVNSAVSDLRKSSSTWMTGTRTSGRMKGTTTLHSEQGSSFKLGTYNMMEYFEEINGVLQPIEGRNMSDVFTSKESALSMISGIEERILEANQVDISGMSVSDMRERILSGMQKDSEDPLDVYGLLNRFPTQSEGSIASGRVMIDPNIRGPRMITSLGTARNMGGDYDGDTVYAMLDAYRKGNRQESLPEIQSELKRLSEQTNVRSLINMREDLPEAMKQSAFEEASQLTGEAASQFYQEFSGDTAEALNLIVKSQASTAIGQSDNALVSNRNLMYYTYSESLKRGVVSPSEYNQIMGQYDEVSNKFVQNFISAKKVDMNALGISSEELAGMSEKARQALLEEKASDFIFNQSEVPQLLNNLSGDNMGRLKQLASDMQIVKKEDEASFNQMLESLSHAQEATSFMGGSLNPSFGMKSSGEPVERIQEMIENRPGLLVGTKNVTDLVGDVYGGTDIEKNFYRAQKQTADTVAENMGKRLKTNNVFSETASQQFEAMSQNFLENKGMKEAVEGISMAESLKATTRSVAGSNAFKVGAGFAAMWMIGSAMKSGPTPEGNEAQQEATMTEVNPSALLTSPTARVTPRGQQVQLQVSGKGNVDHQQVAGLINQQVSSMTGMPFDTQIHLTDNTSVLDNHFYEKTINRVLGFN